MKDFYKKFLLLIDGKLPDYDEYLTLSHNYIEAQQRIHYLEQLRKEEKKERERMAIPIAGFDNVAHEPTDTAARIAYAGQVDEFYENILKDKIRVSIADIRELLAGAVIERSLPQNMTRGQYDFLLRGMEAGLWKINDWAITLQGELRQKKDESI